MSDERYRLRWEDEEHIDAGNLHSDQLFAESLLVQIVDGDLFCQTLILEERCCDCSSWKAIDSLGMILINNDCGEVTERIRFEHEMLRNNVLAATS